MSTTTSRDASHLIVVGIDGSEASKDALRWADRLAPVLDASIEAVVAWEYPYLLGLEAGMPEQWHPEEDAHEILRKTVESVFGQTPPVTLTSAIRRGHPAAVLLDASRGAKMLIVGSRGFGGLKGLLLGAVSATTAEHATCPVLVVHPEIH